MTDVPDTLKLEFLIKYDKYDLDIIEQGTLHLPGHSLYFGRFLIEVQSYVAALLLMIMGETRYFQKGECDIWIVKTEGKDHWRMLSIKRKTLGEGFFVQIAHSQEQLTMMLIAFIDIYHGKLIAIDFSIFYSRIMGTKTVEEMRHEFLKLLCFIDFYSKK